ncbi:arsenate reductase (glutaredoxin) [Magnetovirga frankeli]|uniref:arsenate reductase (glutaredoxin) n=1 Tax=Magnetovirga frankeli TaxID=947516 RepID=UPI001293CEAA|nr:arsenate reductase (glutaredoxin) [gamma proteobacterium SS-5]
MSLEIYHNPRCSKSRQALALLEGQGLEPQIINYLDSPPDAARLEQILDLLRMQPRDLMRKGESEYKDLNLADPDLSREELIAAMVAHPRLIERPIVIRDDQAARLGRPPEQVLELFA